MYVNQNIKKKPASLMHRWGIPVSYVCLWLVGIFLSTNILGIWDSVDSDTQTIASIAVVFFLFLIETSLLFTDMALENNIKVLHIRICIFWAIWVFMIALAFFAILFFWIYREYMTNCIMIVLFVLLTAFAKGMYAWLQNNLERFSEEVNIPDMGVEYILSFQSNE